MALSQNEGTTAEAGTKLIKKAMNQFEQELRKNYKQVNVDELIHAIQVIPANYEYEIIKTVLKLIKAKHDFITKEKE